MNQFYLYEAVKYKSVDDAWDSYIRMVHEGEPISSEQYHHERLAFTCGIVAAMNLVSTLINEDTRDIHIAQKTGNHMGNVLVEAMNKAMEEYQRKKGE